MNRTLTCLLGLFLAAPLAAQHDRSVEQIAADMLRLSAEKAAAGHETAAAELAMRAAEMLTKQAAIHREHARNAEREAATVESQLVELERSMLAEAHEDVERNEQVHEWVIVQDGQDNSSRLNDFHVEIGELHSDLEGQLFELQSLGYLGEQPGERKIKVMISPDGPHSGHLQLPEERIEYIVHGEHDAHAEHGEHGAHGEHGELNEFIFLGSEGMDNHFTPMDGGDLHQELRAIHHELEQLRHELRMLRSSMNGGQGRGMGGNRNARGGRWQGQGQGSSNMWGGRWEGDMGGSWEHSRPQAQRRVMRLPGELMEPMEPMEMRGHMMLPRMQMRMEGLPHDFNEQIREEIILNLGLEGMEGDHDVRFEFHGDGDGEEDFDFEMPEGVETHSQIKVIINGEVFEGDEARAKLKELQGGEGAQGRIRMGRALPHTPTPPEPPKAPTRGNWRRSENHEDL